MTEQRVASVEAVWDVISINHDRNGAYITARHAPSDSVEVFDVAYSVNGKEFLGALTVGSKFTSTLTCTLPSTTETKP